MTYKVPDFTELKRFSDDLMDNVALNLVYNYAKEHLDKSDPEPEFTVFIPWKAKILANWKYLVSTTLSDGMYYEVTYDGAKELWYFDAYKKFENRAYAATPKTEKE